ncbi:MAG TPA: adenosine-specific kinase [Jatrophihabitans sp.]|nr:adenosine-specific kinase [Jatrophihabitans sp.]
MTGATGLRFEVVDATPPSGANLILGQAHFVKTVEDLHETLAAASPRLRFGVAFCEASGPRLVRFSGNDPELADAATGIAAELAAGHCFVVLLRDGFPLNVLNAVKALAEVCTVFCASANPVQAVLAVTGQGRGVLGVVDGEPPLGVESDADRAARHALLRELGYKL